MTYIEQFEANLIAMIRNSAVGMDVVVRFASEKVLESYRNGLKDGQKETKVIRDGKCRRRPIPPQAQ